MRNCLILALVVAISFIFSGILQAQTPSNDERIRKLEEICQQQEQQIGKLQSQLGVLQNDETYKTYTEQIVKSYLNESVAQEDDGITAGYENGFFLRGADGKLQLTINGYLQAGLGIFENDTFDNNSFFLHGVYTMFDVRIMEKWHVFIKVNFAGDQFVEQFQNGGTYDVSLADAFLEYNYRPELNFIVGNQLVPFSIEGQYAETDGISIWQEPFINSWSHGLDVGFLMHGVIANRVGYRVGIFNGAGSNTLNNNDEMLMAAQARFYICGYDKNKESFIHVGFLRNRDEDIVARASLFSPWGRNLFDNGTGDADTAGWRTSVDAGAKLSVDMANGSNFRAEGEFMFSAWERENGGTRYAWLHGYGFWVGASYRHCLNKENEGSGIIVMGKFSYNDIDNKDTDDSVNIVGQTAYVYTVGLGYAFNKHIAVNANWVIMNLDQKDYYGGPKNRPSGDVSGSLEQAWFMQFTAMW